MVKKVLFILPNFLEKIGGIESYVIELKNIFEKQNFNINYYILNFEGAQNKNELNNIILEKNLGFKYFLHLKRKNYILAIYYLLKIRQALKKQISINEYSLIIDNTNIGYLNLYKNSKAIWIQHFDIEYLFNNNLTGISKYFLFILKFFLKTQVSYKKYQNVVFYSNNSIYKKINNNSFFGSISISDSFFKNDLNFYLENKNNEIVYFGRLDNESKNLDLINRIAIKGNKKINIFGDGPYYSKLIGNKNLVLHGKILNKEKIDLLKKYNIFLLTSNYEGICISAIELLSMGIIGIIRDSYIEARNIIPSKYYDLLLVNKDSDYQEYLKKINYIDQLSSAEKNAIRIDLIDHVKNNFSIKKFEANWISILKNLKID